MTTFLGTVAKALLDASDGRTENHIVIVPGRRTGLYLRREMADLAKRPVWAPEMPSLSEFMARLTGLRAIENSELTFMAFEAYQSIGGEDDFERYLRWAPSAIADFASVDHHLADAGRMFDNLRDIREIEQWSLREDPLSADQLRLVRFCASLGKTYRALRQKLAASGLAYPAMMVRHAAENIDDYSPELFKNRIWMVGFNALTPAELRVARWLTEMAGMRTFTDSDRYYTEDVLNDAGLHIRVQNAALKTEPGPTEMLLTGDKHIRLIPCSGEAAQAKMMARMLSEPEADSPAVVLCNENMLPAVLESIPLRYPTFNVSAGISLAKTPAHETAMAILALFGKKSESSSEVEIYHRHLTRFLRLPSVSAAVGPGHEISDFLRDIVDNNRITIRWFTDSAKYPSLRVLDGIMQCIGTVDGRAPLKAIGAFLDIETDEGTDIDKEYLFRLRSITGQLLMLTDRYPFVKGPEVLKSLLGNLLRSETMTFHGEPLSGLQILGLLETRNLDFKHVILLGANEGHLPAGGHDAGLLPHDLRAAFGLPGQREREALYAYYFYRLIQRAERVDILYTSTGGEGLATSEVSRYVRQLQFEAPDRNPRLKFETVRPGYFLSAKGPEFEIASDEDIRTTISARLKIGISPSALTTYIQCPLDFYYRYILGLGEAEEVEETPEESTFGSIVHGSLEKLYTPLLTGLPLTEANLQMLLANVDQATSNTFAEYFSASQMDKGQNLLTLHACQLYAANAIKCDINRVRSGEHIVLTGLETSLSAELIVSKNLKLLIAGKADRIELCNGRPLIVDYKTGKGDDGALKIKNMAGIGKKPKALQLMMYARMLQAEQHVVTCEAGIVFLRSHSRGLVRLSVSDSPELTDDTFREFDIQLGEKIENMLATENVFRHNPKSKYCNYCQ